MVTLYTLPTCGICNMVKTKLLQNNIPFEEKNFSEIVDRIKSDRAPALEVTDSANNITIYNSPTEIVKWINEYGE